MLEEEFSVKVISTVKVSGKTGVEMEALHSTSVALLTIYDMCKAVSKSMIISEIRLEKKSGGKSENTRAIYENKNKMVSTEYSLA